MPTRREVAAGRRAERHRRLEASATTLTGRLWRYCNWLIAEAKAHNRLTEVTAIIDTLIGQLRAGEPLTGTPAPPPEPEPPGSSQPWYMQMRDAPSDRRDDVA